MLTVNLSYASRVSVRSGRARSPMSSFASLPDAELFELVLSTRAAGRDANTAIGALCERWRRPAGVVVRRIQASYRTGSPDDEAELYQEAVRKFVEKGLDQFRGASEVHPGQAASPKTFFLRIVKHAAIDAYRKQRELLEDPHEGDEEHSESPHQVGHAVGLARREEEREGAADLYWAAFARLEREHPNEASAWEAYHHLDLEDHEACAKHLGITVANSYKRVSRAQAHLRLFLMELDETRET